MRLRVPIAITGMGLRVPGASSPGELWSALMEGRVHAGRLGHERPHLRGGGMTLNSHRAGWLDDVAAFDAGYFGIADGEAAGMDPQQRVLLHTACEALADAHLNSAAVRAGRTGVWVAQMDNAYWHLISGPGARLDLYDVIGSCLPAGISGRVATAIDARGPAVTLDAACASSLLAVEQAASALASGEIDIAVVGAVSLLLHAQTSAAFAGGRVLAADGLCKFGSASADGYARSEGAVTVVLRRLPDAVAGHEPVHAVVLGGATRHSGASRPMYSPSLDVQHEMIEEACANAGVERAAIGYVEAHGTGTVAGDRTEIGAIARAFGAVRTPADPLPIGSVKTAIGHLEPAAGLAGLVKAVQILKHRTVPGTAVPGEPCAALTDAPHVLLPAEPVGLRDGATVVGVSSFGVTGVTSHLLLAAPPEPEAVPDPPGPHLLVLSGHTAQALRTTVERVRRSLAGGSALARVSSAAALGRDHREHRVAIVAGTGGEAASLLESAEQPAPGAARVVFVFPGQGGQYPGMGVDLLDSEPVFHAALTEADAAVAARTGWSVIELLRSRAELRDAPVVQPVVFAVQYALAMLWRSFGITPDAVVGHSLGEVSAAVVAGALTVEQGARVVAERSHLAAELGGTGAMAWLGLGEEETDLLLGAREGLSAAAWNGPGSTVVSGDPAAVAGLLAECGARNIDARAIDVDFASHSPAMDRPATALAVSLRGLVPAAAGVAIRSSVTARRVEGTELTPSYWAGNLRSPVRFAAALDAELAAGPAILVEVSPHPVLTGAMRAEPKAAGLTVTGTLHRDLPPRRALLGAVAELFTAGADPDFARIVPRTAPVPLPPPAWQTRRFWRPAHPRHEHPLLGGRVETGGDRWAWRRRRRLDAGHWLHGHRVDGATVLPAAAYLRFAAAAAQEIYGPGPVTVRDLSIPEPCRLDAELDFTTSAEQDGENLRIVMTGGATAVAGAAPGRPGGWSVSGGAVVAGSAVAGNAWTGEFAVIRRITRGTGTALVELAVREPAARDETEAIPLTDGCLQAALAALAADSPLRSGPILVAGVAEFRQYLPFPDEVTAHVRVAEAASGRWADADVLVRSGDGRVVAEFEGVRLTAPRRPEYEQALHRVLFEPVTAGLDPVEDRPLLLVGADPGWAASLRAQGLTVRAGSCADAGEGESVLYCRPLALDGTAGPPEAERVVGELLDDLRALTGLGRSGLPLWILTRFAVNADGREPLYDPAAAALWGLGRVLQWEEPAVETRLVDVDGLESAGAALARLLRSDTRENQVAVRSGEVLAARFRAVPAPSRAARGARTMIQPRPGDPRSIAAAPYSVAAPREGELTVRVGHLGVNFHDVLQSMGLYPGQDRSAPPLFLTEFSGRVIESGPGTPGWPAGTPVIGCAGRRGMTTHVTLPAALCARIGEGTDPAAAAALPVAYATAHQALIDIGGLGANQTVVIHSAAGAVGQAAMAIARRAGARIFATAGTSGRRRLLLDQGAERVADSRTLDFTETFATPGGVDVVLDMLAGPAARANFALLAPDGRYVTVAKRDLADDAALGMGLLAPNRRIAAVDLAALAEHRPGRMGEILRTVVELVERGDLPELPHRVFPVGESGAAFLALSEATHVGKFVLAMDGTDRPVVRNDAAYIVTGGLGGIGRSMARWLVGQGAGRVVLTGRRADPGPLPAGRTGTEVVYESLDVADEPGWRDLLSRQGLPVRGVFHTAGEVPVAPLAATGPAQLRAAFHAKAGGAWALQRALADTPLDFFAVTSSVVSVLGGTPVGTSLGAYAAANAFCDALGQERRRRGLPATVVNWGYWAEVGMVAELEGRSGRRLAPPGVSYLQPGPASALFGALVSGTDPQTSVFPVDWAGLFATYPSLSDVPLLAGRGGRALEVSHASRE